MAAALEMENLSVVYGAAIEALNNVSIMVPEGGFVSLLGTNGAGKSTLLKAVSGLLLFENGRATATKFLFRGLDISSIPSFQRARLGILHVREGRFVLPNMTVEENLEAASFARGKRGLPNRKKNYDEIFEYFPSLNSRRKTYAGYLSGGEQQMLAIGRALFAEPELLMVDEASLGLAPKIAADIFEILKRINQERNLSILIVEQNVSLALKHSTYAYILENGRITEEGCAEKMLDREMISRCYLGASYEQNLK